MGPADTPSPLGSGPGPSHLPVVVGKKAQQVWRFSSSEPLSTWASFLASVACALVLGVKVVGGLDPPALG